MKKVLMNLIVLMGILFALTATAQIQYSNEFWISTNATGNMYPSGGTLDDPFDGSTAAKFDSNMNDLPTNSTVHILAGTYQTFGFTGWTVKMGQKIHGSGIDNTILQLNFTNPTGLIYAIQSLAGVSNAEVCDLTCNCNFGTGNNTPSGVDLDGCFNAVRRVKVINTEFHGGTSEAWGIVLSNSQFTDSVGNAIEDCEVSHFAGGGSITSISFNGGYGNSMSGTIRNNRIFLPGDVASDEKGINGSCNHDVLIEGNYVDGAEDGVYGDTCGCTNMTIVNNTLKNCFFGVTYYGLFDRKNIMIAYNHISVPTNGVAFNFWSGTGASGYAVTNVDIIGNTIESLGGPSSTSFIIGANNLVGLFLINNYIDSLMASNQLTTTFYSNVDNVTIDNNYDLFGNYLYDLNVPTIGGVAVSPFGLSLVNSAEASSVLTNLGLPSNPSAVVTNGQSGLTLSGAFSGNGSGLTGLNWSDITGVPTFAQYSDPSPTFTNGMNIGANLAYQIGGWNVLWASNSFLTGDNFVVGREPSGVIPNGLGNLIVGSYAMPSSTNANYSTMVGINAGRSLLSSQFNTIVGADAGYVFQSGSDNTFVGFGSGYGGGTFTNGNENTLIGDNSLYRARSGTNNITLGYLSGSWLYSGNNNVFIAHQGTSVETNSNGTIYIGDPGTHSTTYIAGNVYAGNGIIGTSLIATNGFQCSTNYSPSLWTPVPGSVMFRASNNWMYAITQYSTNAAFKIGP